MLSFSEITRLALEYFYSEIFTDKIKDNYYTLEMVKGFLDANNLTTYTAIHEINVPFYALKDAPLFKHCWCQNQVRLLTKIGRCTPDSTADGYNHSRLAYV